MSLYDTKLLSRAHKAYSLGKFRSVLKICNKILKINPLVSEALLLVARTLPSLEDIKLCSKWSSIFHNACSSSSDSNLLYAYGLFLRHCDSYEKSTKYLEKALSLAPNNTEYYFELSTNYYVLKLEQKQLELLKNATSRFPTKAKFWYLLGNIYHRKKQFNEAKECYLQAVELEPSNSRYCEKLADVAFQLEDYPTAKKYFEQAFNLDPVNSFLSWDNLLVIYHGVEQNAKKTEQLLKAVEENALDVPEKWERLGEFYFFALKDYARALNAYEKILASDQDDTRVLQRVVDCAIELKQYSRAVKILKRSIKHKKSYSKFLLLATLLTKKGELDKAEKAYKKAIKQALKHSFFDSDQSYCYFRYGLFLEEIKEDTNAAKEAYLKAFEIYQFNLVALSRYNKINKKDHFLPLVTSAIPQFGYLLGENEEYEALVFDSIESLGSVKYQYMLILYPYSEPFPVYIVALETNPVAISLGNYFFCAFTGSKHVNYGIWKEEMDIETFADSALKLVIKTFNIDPNTIQRLD